MVVFLNQSAMFTCFCYIHPGRKLTDTSGWENLYPSKEDFIAISFYLVSSYFTLLLLVFWLLDSGWDSFGDLSRFAWSRISSNKYISLILTISSKQREPSHSSPASCTTGRVLLEHHLLVYMYVLRGCDWASHHTMFLHWALIQVSACYSFPSK